MKNLRQSRFVNDHNAPVAGAVTSIVTSPSARLDAPLLAEQGVYLAPGQAIWQFGQLQLSADRLRFAQPRGVIFEAPLAWLLGIGLTRKRYIVVHKPALAVTYRNPAQPAAATVHFLTPRLGPWLAHLTPLVGGMTPALPPPGVDDREKGSSSGVRVLHPPPAHTGALPALTPQELGRVAALLDDDSRAILAYLADNSHAPLRALAEQIAAPTDMHVLFCIQQAINPAAQAVLGRPILFFAAAQFDQIIGDQVTFEWWLAGRRGRTPPVYDVVAEVYDEDAAFLVVVDLTGADADAIDCTVSGAWLTVSAVEPVRTRRSVVELPAPVAAAPLRPNFTNGILSIRLEKTREG